MRIRIEIAEPSGEDEIIIRCGRVDETIQRIHRFILDQTSAGPKLVFYKDTRAFFFPLDEVLFFETESETVFAHTATDAFRTKHRLYELENILPRAFIRVAKSTIVNTARIFSIRRDLTASSLIQFTGTHKQIYASRRYFPALRDRMNERGGYHDPQ